MMTRHEMANKYKSKMELLGVDEIEISLLDGDRVRLDRVKDNDQASIKLPSFITDIKVEVNDKGNIVYSPFYNTMYEHVYVECDLKDISGLFSWMSSNELEVEFKYGDVLECKDLFSNSNRLKRIEVKGLDTSRVKDMSNMFKECMLLDDIDLSWLDIRNVEYMDRMFAGCVNIKSISILSKGNKVKSLKSMYLCCESVESIDMSGVGLGDLEYMDDIFRECGKLKRVKFTRDNISNNIKRLQYICRGCNELDELDLSFIGRIGRLALTDLLEFNSSLSSVKEIDLRNVEVVLGSDEIEDLKKYGLFNIFLVIMVSGHKISKSLLELVLSVDKSIKYKKYDGYYIMDSI